MHDHESLLQFNDKHKTNKHLYLSQIIIECDSTLYVGMTRKQNGGPIPRIHCSFAKYRLLVM